jgi:hypothetical protein
MAAECRYAETGVGAAIARGSQKWNGTCALLASAATAINAAATAVVVPPSARSIRSGRENVSYSW